MKNSIRVLTKAAPLTLVFFLFSFFLTAAFARADFKRPIPLEDILVTGHPTEGIAQIWNYETGEKLGVIQIHEKTAPGAPKWDKGGKVYVSPDGETLLAGKSCQTGLGGWFMRTGKRRFSPLPGSQGEVDTAKVSFSPDGKFIARSGWAGGKQVAQIYNAANGAPLRVYVWEKEEWPWSRFTPDSKYLVVNWKVWDFQRNQFVPNNKADNNDRSHQLAYSPDGKRVLCALEGTTRFLVNRETGESLWSKDYDWNIQFLPEEQGLVTSWNKKGYLIDYQTGEKSMELEYIDDDFQLTSDGKYAVCKDGQKIVLIDIATGKILQDKTIDTGCEIRTWSLGLAQATLQARKNKTAKAEPGSKPIRSGGTIGEQAKSEPSEGDQPKTPGADFPDTKANQAITRGFTALRLEQLPLAIEAFNEAAEAEPTEGQASCLLGLLYLILKQDVAEANKLFVKSVRLDIKNPAYLNNFAITQFLLKKYSVALSSWERMAKIDAQSPELARNIGLMMTLFKNKKINLEQKDAMRLLDLYGSVCTDLKEQISLKQGFLCIPPQTGAADRPDCREFFTRKNRGKAMGEPFEVNPATR